ncbi:MAG: SPFH domain-containing protein [bacterium]|nr:SPFH domain-containing protein [bacterium]
MLYIGIAVVAVVAFLTVILLTGYVRASPDTAIIISGPKKEPKILIGCAGIKIPFFEKKDELSLQLVQIDVKTADEVPTADYINITVDATVGVKISDKRELLAVAAQNFLNRPTEYISGVAREVLEGNVREIVGKMNLAEMVSDRQKFGSLVTENAKPDLNNMGLEIISFNVQNFFDKNGVIENLGVDNIVKIQKDAAISRAMSEKEIEMAKAEAAKEANDAKVAAELEIAEKNTELELRKSELKKQTETKRATAEAAFSIQKEMERKTIELAAAEANIAKQEKAIEMQEQEVRLTERTLEANIKKKAEAEKYEQLQKADAELYAAQRDAEASLYEMQKQAEAEKYQQIQQAEAMKISAEAERYAQEQEAEGIRKKGLAEAEAIRAKAVAEADGVRKKAEAMKLMGEASILEMYFNALPQIAQNVAEPLAKVDKITMYGDGNSTKLVSDIVRTMTQVSDGVQESTGLDLKSVIAGLAGGKFLSGMKADNNADVRDSTSYEEPADNEELTGGNEDFADDIP